MGSQSSYVVNDRHWGQLVIIDATPLPEDGVGTAPVWYAMAALGRVVGRGPTGQAAHADAMYAKPRRLR